MTGRFLWYGLSSHKTLATKGLDLAYGQSGRLASASSGGNLLGQYAYAFDGHRAAKTVQGSTTLFHYGVDGNLLAETDAAGATLKEYVLDDDGRPLAQIEAGAITFLHPDHLGTPRFGTDAGKAVVWQWYERPFGTGPPSGYVTVNLRFPGQYADSETGFFQNWYRTYDPASGRYLESDPIGLAAGVNTFGYADANPLGKTDRLGLDWSDSIQSWWQSSVAGFQSDTPLEMVSRTLQGLPVEGAFVAGVGAIKRISSVEQCVAKSSPLWTSTKNSTAAQNAYRHFKDHGVDFNAQNAVEYARKTKDFLHNPPSGTISKTRANGDVVRYDPATNTFGVMNEIGTPRTFFKPDPTKHGYSTNMDYFNAQ